MLRLINKYITFLVSAKPGKNWKEELFSQNVNPNYILDWLERVVFSDHLRNNLDDPDRDRQARGYRFVGHVGENVSLNCQKEVYYKGNFLCSIKLHNDFSFVMLC